MSWGLIGLAGTAVMGFWFIYDRVKYRNRDMRAAGAAQAQTEWLASCRPEVWDCPVCGRKHTSGRSCDGGAAARVNIPWR